MKQRTAISLLALAVVVGSWKGFVALFDRGAAEPKQIFPTLVSSLPLQDQLALEEGILIRNQRDLNQLLEDYTS